MTSVFVPGNRLLSPLNESLTFLKINNGRKKSSSVDDASSALGEKGITTESVDCKQVLTDHLKVKLSSDSTICKAKQVAKKVVPLKKRVTKEELINDMFGTDFTSKELDESCEQKNVKKLSLDSKGIKQIVCENVPDVVKHETGLEKKVHDKAFKCEPQEKTPKTIEHLPSARNKSMKVEKSVLKDIVKVRNSYKDILDSDNGAIEVANAERDRIPSEVAVPQQTEVAPAAPAEVAITQQLEVGPAAPPDNWVGCDHCEKWRLLPIGIEPDNLPEKWLCSMTTWL